MRFHSTPESALNLEITKLAIIETVLAVAIYVSAGLYFGTFKYLAFAVLVAPLMLLRTQVSAEWGLKIYARYGRYISFVREKAIANKEQPEELNVLLAGLAILGILCIPFIAAGTRVISAVYWALRRPLLTLREIPQNWLRQSFCIDFFHPPEYLPNITPESSSISKLFSEQTFSPHKGVNVMMVMVATLWLVLMWLPSLLYRVSFKATSIVYLPLVWIAQLTLRNPLPIKVRLNRITQGEIEKVRRGFHGSSLPRW